MVQWIKVEVDHEVMIALALVRTRYAPPADGGLRPTCRCINLTATPTERT